MTAALPGRLSFRVTLYTLDDAHDLIAPVMLAAFDGWVDAGSAATTALDVLAEDGAVVATFDADRLFDYRARRPPLEIVDGRLTELTWPELVLRRTRLDERDLLVLVGPEPDYRWRAFTADVIDLVRPARRLRVDQPRGHPGGRAAHPGGADHRDRGDARTAARRGHGRSGRHAAGPVGAGVGARDRGRRCRHPGARLFRAGPPLRVRPVRRRRRSQLLRAIGTHLGTEIPARAAGRGVARAARPGSIPRPVSTTRRAPTSNGSSRCTTSSGCRPATTSSRTSSGSCGTRAGRNDERPGWGARTAWLGDRRRTAVEAGLPAPPPPGIPPEERRAAGRGSRCPAVRSR